MNVTTEFNTGPSPPTTYGTPFFLGEFVSPQTLMNYYGIPPQQAVCKNILNSQVRNFFLTSSHYIFK
jgi:hypothetical protein